MRKAYVLKRLTGQVKRFAAFMLITLLAVGNAFADYDGTGVFTKINSADELTTGYYVITNQTGEFAMQNQVSTTSTKYIFKTDAVFNNPTADIVWLVTVSDGGQITLYNEAADMYAAYSGSGNSAYMISDLSDQGRWTATLDDDGNWVLENAATSGRYLNYNAGSPRFACYNNHNQQELSFYKQGDAPALAAPTFSLPSGSYLTEQTVSLTAVAGANIYYSINGGEFILFSDPFTVNTTTTVNAYAVLGEDTSAVATATYAFPVPMANIAAFNAANNGFYTLEGDVTFVYRNGSNMYVQDATGGLLVYDANPAVITTQYNEGDVISGLTGNRTLYNGVVEMLPTLNTAAGVAGVVTPVEVTVADLLANPAQYVSNLVIVRNGTFAAGSFNTSSKTGIDFTQGGSTVKVYNNFKTVTATYQGGEPAIVLGVVGLYNGVPQIYPRSNADIINTAVPYVCDLEDGAIEWTIANGDNTNKWYIGTAQGFDNKKLYISSSNGVTNKYNVSAASNSHAYMYTVLPNSDVVLSFDCRTVGDENDYLQVSVLDEAPVAGVLPTTYLARIYGVNDFTTQNVVIPAAYAGGKYIVFTWHNNANGGTQTPAAIDNVSMNTTCTTPTNVAATVNGQSAVITWNAPEGQNAWTLQYKAADGDAWQSVEASSATVTLNNLSTEVTYDVRVKANCGEESSLWATSQFYVPCVALTTNPMNFTIGNGTNTSYYAPFGAYYKNSWVQMVYPASNFDGPGYINSLSWEVNSALTHSFSALKIYIGTTTHANNESTTDWLPMDELTLVYEANNSTIGSAAGWETYTLTTPFYYNGEDNLVIVTSRAALEYKALYYKATGNNTNAVMYRWNDNDASYAQHPGSSAATGRVANLPNMKVDYTGYVCGDAVCAAPENLNVNDVTTESAVLTWDAGDATAWQLNYKAETAADWTTVNVTENTYTLTNLDQYTNYLVRVKADCGTVGMSSEAVLNFITVANCVAPQNLTVTATTHTVNVNWMPVEGVNEYVVKIEGVNNDDNFVLNILNASQTNLTGLAEGNQYLISVRSICGEEEVSDWTSVNFTMPAICAAPTGIAVTNVNENSATLTWTDNGAETWTVEYGLLGFTQGTGTQVVVNENTVTLTGLNGYSTYEVYMKSDCGLGYVSNWSPVFKFKTECGPITVTEGNPWIEDFESYSGSGNLAFDNCWATPEMSSFNSPFIYRNYATTAHSGKNTAELKGNSGAVSTLVLPLFTNPLSDLQFSYYGMVTGSTPGTMQLGYITDVEDASTFVELQTIPAQSGSYNRANSLLYGPFTFGNDVPAGARITLRFTSATSNCSWNLDDFTVGLRPDCTAPLPTSVTVSNVTATEATVAWTDENEDNNAWRVYYKANGESNWMSADFNTNPGTITGLTPLTSYEVYVVTLCGTDESGTTNTVTFNTSMIPAAIPYITNFTGNDWKLNNGTCTNHWAMGTPSNKSYSGLYITNDGTTATYTISSAASGVSAEKMFEVPAVDSIRISFDFESGGESTWDYMKVYFAPSNVEYPATTTNSSGTYTHYSYSTYAMNFLPYLSQTNYTSTSTSYRYKINLTKGNIIHVDMNVANPVPAGGLAKVVFWWRNDGSGGTQPGAIVSNLQVGDLSCMPVTDLTVGNITGSSADLTWTAGAAETEWNVSYKTAAAEEWTTVTTPTPSYTITGLEGVTTYLVEVTPVCEGASAEAATATFTTLCGNQCDYTFVLHDSYGDGWNGNKINVVFSDGTSQTLTLTSGSYGSFDVVIPEGATMTCNWTAGSYVNETSFEIIDGCGATVYSASGTAQSAGFFTGSCPMPACPKPSNITFTGITGTTAIVSWTAGGEETAWDFEYQAVGAEDWTVVSATSTTIALTGLTAGTTYNVRVKAVCSADESSSYANSSFGTCFDGCVYTVVMHDSWGDGWNGNKIAVYFDGELYDNLTITSGNYGTAQLEIPAGETMTLSWVTGSYPSETSFEILDACGAEIYADGGSYLSNGEEFFTQSCAAVSCPAPLALAATDVDDNGTSVITWFAGGEETSWNIILTPAEGDAITAVVTTPTYTITGMQPGDSYEVAVKAICDTNDESAEVTVTVLRPAMVDIKLVNVYTNPSNCDLSNVIARITVKNMMESPITNFEAYYQVNGGPVVHETVWPYLSFDYGETYTYTFNTAPVFTETANVITAWVTVPSETNIGDNEGVSGVTYLTSEQALPFVETFPATSVNNWSVIDNNNDNNTFVIANNAIQYSGSDEVSANDWIVSPCVDYTQNTTYLISFDYKANSPFYNEKLTAYYGPSVNPYNDYPFGTITFNNTEYAHYDYVGYMAMTMDNIHVAFKAESPVGTDGFSIDNVSIKKAVSFSVTAGEHGSVAVENAIPKYSYYYVGENDEVTLVMTPEFGYHVAGIYVNGELARGENPNNASVDYFTFTPSTGDYVTVLFTGNVYHVNATVTNLYATDYNDNAPGAIYNPAHEMVIHGGSHSGVITLNPNYHFVSLTVNGVTTVPMVSNIDGQYFLTLAPVMEDKDIDVVVEIDSAHVIYTVLAGQGTINGHYVVDDNATYPAVYTESVVGYTNLWSTITPAPGYHVASIVIDGVEHNNISEYYFANIMGTHTVNVVFEKNHYYITTHAYGSGTVSAGADFDYDPDYTYTFTATPSAGYRIASVLRNNVELTVADPVAGYTETLTNILSDYNYEVLFVQNTYTVAATSGAHGTVSPAGISNYYHGQDVVYNIDAALGYYVASVTVDGVATMYTQDDNMTSITYTFNNINANHTISATFAQKMYTVTVNAGAHGDITPGTGDFAFGATPTFNITPAAGYGIADVTVDGESVGAVNAYTFPALTANHTIAATFAAYQYTINATAGNGGTITPAGNTTLAYNGTQTYTISANAGYHVHAVYVDGVSVGAVTTYTFTNVTENHLIYAAFEANEYTVTVNQPANGTITPGTTTVLYGATPAFVVTPNVGYNVTAITVNGSNVALANVPNVNGTYTYTFPAISANQTITATMAVKTFTITATAGANGSINPGTQTVNYGASKTFTFAPNAGYVVANVNVDGANLGALSTYTFANVTANHTINVTFVPAECEVPYSMYTTHIGETSAMLHWSHPTATSFDIQYKTTTGTLTSVSNISGNSYELTGLNANTTYLWQVRANCTNSNHSDWSNLVSFTTDATPIEIGIEDLVKSNIKVYAEHQNVHIVNNEGMNIDNVRIFDTYGRLIYSGSVSSEHEVIGLNVAAGTYIVNVTTDQGVANYKVTVLK